jgi:hypothetical protein
VKFGTAKIKAIDPAASLGRVEKLLDQALVDLTGKKSASPASRAEVLLAEAAVELRAFAALSAGLDFMLLRPRVLALVPRLRAAERLLAAAAEFYRGWCAVGAAPMSAPQGYQTELSYPGPALLAFEG